MLELTTFKGGSSGNIHQVSNGDTNILLDCGVNIEDYQTDLLRQGIKVNDIDMILISHEHQDHIRGIGYYKDTKTKIFINERVKLLDKFSHLKKWSNIHWYKAIDRTKGFGKAFTYKGWTILPTQSHHDSIDANGFIVRNNEGKKIFYPSDTGYININVPNCEIYLIEANYCQEKMDREMEKLDDEKRLRRVNSLKGHLSVQEAFKYIEKNKGDKTKFVIYTHLSKGGFDNVERTFKGKEYLPSQEFKPKTYRVGEDDTPDHMKR